jgi:non-ribosomal peptide synthetase component E (peptide arylation enzyme)
MRLLTGNPFLNLHLPLDLSQSSKHTPQPATFFLPQPSRAPFLAGIAKGVELTHRNLVSNLIQSVGGPVPVMQIHPDDVLLGLLPFFHIYGLTTLILTPLVKCVSIVLMPKFDLVQMLELIQKYKITFANLVPPIILALTKHPVVAKYDLSSMRGIMSGAAPLGKELQQAAEKRLKITIAQVGDLVVSYVSLPLLLLSVPWDLGFWFIMRACQRLAAGEGF